MKTSRGRYWIPFLLYNMRLLGSLTLKQRSIMSLFGTRARSEFNPREANSNPKINAVADSMSYPVTRSFGESGKMK